MPQIDRLYKWMLPGMLTRTQRKPWPVKVGEWTPKETPVLCKSGWHGVTEKDVLNHLPDTLGAELYVVEAEGIVHGDDKFAAKTMRLVERIGTTDESNLRLFRCDVAQDMLYLFEAKYPNNSRPRNAIEVARRFANGEATREEMGAAYSAAASAARSAAASAADSAARSAAASAAHSRYSNWLVVRLESGY